MMELQKIIISFSAVWIFMGVYLATLASSYGPIFWGDFGGVFNPYNEYIEHLKSFKSNDTQFLAFYDMLVAWRNDIKMVHANGISAMPSLHVALSFLVFFQTPVHLIYLKIFTGVFSLLILVGSVVLGWHYAVDGYVGIISAYLIWRVTCWVIDKYQKKIAVPEWVD